MNAPLFRAHRFAHFAHRMAPWLRGERLRRNLREGHGKVSAMMWNFTPFDGERPFDDEIRAILAMEEHLGKVPSWAVDIAVQIDALPHCGQITFPEPIHAICRGIGRECAEPAFLFCFEASSATKQRVLQRAAELERWLAGKATEPALGAPTALKCALVEHLVLTLRLWAVELTTNDDGQLTIPLDTGEAKKQVEASRQRLKQVAAQHGFDAERFCCEFDHPWLCHQRLFDQIETTLARIGREEIQYDHQQARQEAQSATDQMRREYDRMISELTDWLDGNGPAAIDALLGDRTPVKVWLVTALRKKLCLFNTPELTETLSI